MTITVKGLKDVQKAFNQALKQTDSATKQEIKDITFDLLGKSVDLAPVEFGDLKGSGKAEFEGFTGTVSFTEEYALRQHEDLTFNHPRGGEAKYLEKPFKENVKKYIEQIGKSIGRVID